MKYYRVIKSGYDEPKGTAPIGKILPENFKESHSSWIYTIGQFVDMSPEDFQEVSEEEYLKQEGKMDKKIIGYKLIKPEYCKVACEIEGYIEIGESIQYKMIDMSKTGAISRLKEAGVLDLWFEPVYVEQFKVGDWVVFEAERVKEEYPLLYTETWNKDHVLRIDEIEGNNLRFRNQLCKSIISNSPVCFRKATEEEIKKAQVPDITINGYKAEFFDDYVKFGCACIAKVQIELALDLINYNSSYTNRTINSITIGSGTFTSNQIKQIAEYYRNKQV